MGAFNINNPPLGLIPLVNWCVQGIKLLFKRTSSGASGGSGDLTTLFDYYTDAGNVGTGETDLYSSTIAAGQLAANGDKLEIIYGGTSSSSDSYTMKIYFGGSLVYDPGTVGNVFTSWGVRGIIIRVSSTVIRYNFVFTGAAPASSQLFTSSGEVTGLTLSGTNILKITVTGTTTNDIVAKLGTVSYITHA